MKKMFCLLCLVAMFSCGEKTTAKVDNTVATPQAKPAVATAVQPKPSVSQNTATPQGSMSLADYKPKNEGWHVELEKAYAESKKTGKPIMANFTGSDWCGWCKRLDASVFHQPGFDKWAKDNVVLLELDFPRRFKLPTEIAVQNQNLQQAFQVRGYPSIWLFDADKDADGKFNFKGLGKTGYTPTIEEFQATMKGYMAAR
jgi:thiol-disulfide isomerase/thioredoxin